MACRLFVGSVAAGVSVEELAARFASFGSVANVVRVPCRAPGGGTDPGVCNFFLDLLPKTDKDVQRCITTYHGCVWRGSRLNIGRASEDYTLRLRKEWSAAEKRAQAEAADALAKAAEAAQPPSAQSLAAARLAIEERLQSTKLRLRAGDEFLSVHACGGPGKHKLSFQRLPPGTVVRSWGEEASLAPARLTPALLRAAAAVEPPQRAKAASAPAAADDPWAKLFRKAAGAEPASPDLSDEEVEPPPEPEPEPEPQPKRLRAAAPAPAAVAAPVLAPPPLPVPVPVIPAPKPAPVAAPKPVVAAKPAAPPQPYEAQGAAATLREERARQLALLQRMGIADASATVAELDVDEDAGAEGEEDAEEEEGEAEEGGDGEEGDEDEEAGPSLVHDPAAWDRALRRAGAEEAAKAPPDVAGEAQLPSLSRRQRARLAAQEKAAAAAAASEGTQMEPARRARVAHALALTRRGEGLQGVYFADSAFDWRALAVRAGEQTWSLLGDAAEAAPLPLPEHAPAPAPAPERAAQPVSLPPAPLDLAALGASFIRPAAALEEDWEASRDALLGDAKRKRKAARPAPAGGRGRGGGSRHGR